ncbi:aldolase/citrate lyase family protein [Pseudactinotalea suaedae]|uniref:aldolase/citrate lyase family protein n=1 Tax=Pseudactinotalea suaedae TaxID=1524924 RepID=UPI00240D6222|nr:aldolase/citrate lyase family protein [Pseudactinotalea suaedae]
MTFREAIATSERPLIGMWCGSASPLVAEICAGSGMDWLLIDGEHAPNDLSTIMAQLHAVAAYPVTPVVRVPVNDAAIIKQVLDLGAQNLVVPMVSTVEEAQAAAAAVRYPPGGVRGVAAALARSGRWGRAENYLADADTHVSLMVQVETMAGVEAAAQIAAVDGVDGVYVGPSDLAASMGLLGQQTHPDVTAAVLATFDAVRGQGKAAGVNAFDPTAARRYLDAGATFITVGADVTLLARGSEDLATRFR